MFRAGPRTAVPRTARNLSHLRRSTLEVPMFRAGLLVLGLLSVADLLLPLLTDGESPPMAVALVAAALGLASLVLVISAWRGARKAILPLIVLRALSAAAALPAFFETGVPTPAIAAAAAVVLLTAVGATLVLKGRTAVAS